MNSTIVLDRIVAARNEGGSAHAVTAAQGLVAQYYPGREFDTQAVVTTVLGAVDRFDRAAAETAINEALTSLRTPVPAPVVAADAAVATDTTDHEARLAALEDIARNNGYGQYVVAGATFEVRLTNLERAARAANLR